jgi:hypothetical protein
MSRIYKNMFAPSPLAGQTYSTNTPNSDPAMSAAKRARTNDVPYTEVDAEKLSLKIRKDDKDGRVYLDLLDEDGNVPHLKLTPKGSSLEVVFGFDMDGRGERRSFHPPDTKPAEPPQIVQRAQKNESLSMVVVAPSELTIALSRIEKRCRDLYFEAGCAGEWKWLLPNREENSCPKNLRIQVGLKGACTPLKVKVAEGPPLLGEGFDFLKACPGSEFGYRSAKVKVTVAPRIWEIKGFCGMSLSATFLFLEPGKAVIKDPFADDEDF